MKKDNLIILSIIILLIILLIIIIGGVDDKEEVLEEENNNNTPNMEEIVDLEYNEIYITVNNNILIVVLDENKTTQALINELKKRDITITAKEYGGFEKVGDLGFTLPTNDKEINGRPGDLLLYQGNKLSLFYGNNKYSYTKIGTVLDAEKDDLVRILGTGVVTITLSLEG